MASIRERRRANGTIAYNVQYKLDGEQTSATFDDEQQAQDFRDSVQNIGAQRAMKAWGITPTAKTARKPKGPTVAEQCRTYIKSRTGIAKSTRYDYESYLRIDIEKSIGHIPLLILNRDDVSEWVNELEEREPPLKPKSIVNRHGFLSAALNHAVRAELMPSNPAAGTRLPRGEKVEMHFLTHPEMELFVECFTEFWRPMVWFMATSGVRFGELAALAPSNVNQAEGTVWVGRSLRRTYDEKGWEIGPTKSTRSERLINVDPEVLADLDYSRELLFMNTAGKMLNAPSFRNNVWYPTTKKAQAKGLAKKPRIHDMRHTSASWMIQAGVGLPVVQRHLGHENITTTINQYGHLDRADFAAAAAKIGKRRT